MRISARLVAFLGLAAAALGGGGGGGQQSPLAGASATQGTAVRFSEHLIMGGYRYN